MGNPLSPILANIFMTRLEADVVQPTKPAFYDRYVDDCFSKEKKDQPDHLFESLNSYHLNITISCEENPDNFLDTAFEYIDGIFNCEVYTYIGAPKRQKSRREIASQALYTELSVSLLTLTKILNTFNKDSKKPGIQTVLFQQP